mgnify:CR=1 FL=1
MKAEQVIGAVGMSTMTIRPGDTSVAQGINDLPVVSSNNILLSCIFLIFVFN